MRLIIIAGLVLLGSCEVKIKTDADSAKTEEKQSDTEKKVRNGITLKEKDLKVHQAFLMFDDGRLIPQDNKVEVGEKVKMRLILEGWKEEEGKAFPGASETITTNSGETVLETNDLFSAYSNGLPVSDANIITLSATITGVDKLYDHFNVTFRVWDKKSNGEINGSYKLYLK